MNLETLEDYFKRGLLMKQVHPTHDLTIWNYTRKTQYGRLWDEVTLNCRGLVTNSEGEIVARPFSKFFNYEQLVEQTERRCDVCRGEGLRQCGFPDDCKAWVTTPEIPNEPFEIFEKMDGCLGLYFNYKGEWIFGSRASFTSVMSRKGVEILETYRMTLLSDKDIYDAIGYRDINDYTLICEIIYPEIRIVVDYKGREDVMLLGMVNKKDGSELDYDILVKVANITGMPLTNRLENLYEFEELKTLVPDNSEGYVIRFKSGFRMKIKGAQYCRLHGVLTEFSNRDIWQCLKDGRALDEVLGDVPDEFDNWVRAQENMLREMFDVTLNLCMVMYYQTVNPEMTKKEAAEVILKKKKPYPGIFFSIYDGHDISSQIWDQIYPEIYLKPFLNEAYD